MNNHVGKSCLFLQPYSKYTAKWPDSSFPFRGERKRQKCLCSIAVPKRCMHSSPTTGHVCFCFFLQIEKALFYFLFSGCFDHENLLVLSNPLSLSTEAVVEYLFFVKMLY